MKIKHFILPLVFVCVLVILLFSGRHVYLNESDILIVSNQDGNPILVLDDGVYYVRYWNMAPGCYKLTKINLLDYNFASQTSGDHCPVKAMNEP